MWKFCIRKLPIGRSGATSKIGLEHKEFSYREILHKEIPYRGKWHFSNWTGAGIL